MWRMICNLASGQNKTKRVLWPTSLSRQIFVGQNERKRKWRYRLFWLVLRHEVPRSLAADWSKRLSVLAHSGYTIRTNTALAGFLGVIRAFCSAPGRRFVFSRTLWHRREDKVVAGRLLFSRETSYITRCQHACDQARWALFCWDGSVASVSFNANQWLC